MEYRTCGSNNAVYPVYKLTFIWNVSVCCRSLCNEGGCLSGDPDGGLIGSAFKKAIFDVDQMRPLTGNFPSWDNYDDDFTRVLDVESFSYGYGE